MHNRRHNSAVAPISRDYSGPSTITIKGSDTMSGNSHYTSNGNATQVLTGTQLTELRQVTLAYLGLESELDAGSSYWPLYEAVKIDPGAFDVIQDWVTTNLDPKDRAETTTQILKLISEINNYSADLAVVAREYLDLPNPVADLDRVSQDPALRGLLNAVRVNPGDPEAVRDWAACLTPDLRAAFAPAWEAALRALQAPNRNSTGDTEGTDTQAAGAAAEPANEEAEARAVAGRLEAQPLTRLYKHTDVGNGERLAAKFGAQLRYCHPWKKWLYWDGRRWDLDRTGVLPQCAKRTVRAIYPEEMTLLDEDDKDGRYDLAAWARKSEDYKRVTAMARLAESELHIPLLPEDVDRDPWLLNVQNCTLDLRLDAANRSRPHSKVDLITKLAPVTYDRDATCPKWLSTLKLVFADNARLIKFWQQLCGIALTGKVGEQILPILYGGGSNGKSTIINTMLGLLGGDYAMKAPQNFLMIRRHETHPTEIADLFGKRLVAAIETGEGVRINEPLIKELTGGDKIRARRMREDFWEFSPTHKIWLGTNHRPTIRGTDHAIWRRLREIPFTVTIPLDKAIKDMDRLLVLEYSGILNWCIDGVLSWQREGLITPEEVTTATAEYKAQQDIITQFFASECVLAGTEARAADAEKPLGKIAIKANAKALHAAFNNWLSSNTGRGPMAPQDFARQMTEHGYETRKNSTTRALWYVGVGLQSDSHHAKDQDVQPEMGSESRDN